MVYCLQIQLSPTTELGVVDNWSLRQPFDDTISLPKSKGEFSIFPTKNGFFSEYSQRKHLSSRKKLKFQQISLHNEIYKQSLTDLNRELSTFSTGFSTGVKKKSVDNSRSNFVYTIFSTVVHNSVECDLIYITTKFHYVIPRKGEALTWESHR